MIEAAPTDITIVVHTDWRDPAGAREVVHVGWHDGMRLSSLVDLVESPDQPVVRINGRQAEGDAELSPGDLVDFAVVPGGEQFLIQLFVTVFVQIGSDILTSVLYGSPDAPTEPDDDSNAVYGWTGIRTSYQSAGLTLPYVAGTMRVGGYVVQRSLSVIKTGAAPKSVLRLLLAVSSGPCARIAGQEEDADFLAGADLQGVDIAGNDVKNLDGVVAYVRMGSPTQEPIPGFNRVETIEDVAQTLNPYFSWPNSAAYPGWPYPESAWTSNAASYTMIADAQRARITIQFPGGLYTIKGDGSLQHANIYFQIRYRVVDSGGSPLSGWVLANSAPDSFRAVGKLQAPFPVQFEFPLLNPATYAAPGAGQAVVLSGGGHSLKLNSGSLALPDGIGQWTAGSTVQAMTFSLWVYIPAALSQDPATWLGGWFDSTQAVTAAQLIDETATHEGFAVRIREFADGDLQVQAVIGGGSAGDVVQLGVADGGELPFSGVAPDGWAHVAVSFEGGYFGDGENRMRLYVNGDLVDDRKTSVGMKLPADSSLALQLGTVNPFGGLGVFPAWIFDDCAMYSRALAPAEITSIWASGAGQPPPEDAAFLVQRWRFDGSLNADGGTVAFQDVGGTATYQAGIIALAGQVVDEGNLARYQVQLLGATGSEDSFASVTVINDGVWANIIGITDDELSYPGVGLIGYEIDATEQLSGNEPNIRQDVTGPPGLAWDDAGQEWSEVETSNPAWRAAAWIVDRAQGLGRFFTLDQVDGPSFLEWATHCDELVIDQLGQTTARTIEATSTVIDAAATETLTMTFLSLPGHWKTGVRVRIQDFTLTGAPAAWSLAVASMVDGPLDLEIVTAESNGIGSFTVIFLSPFSSTVHGNLVSAGSYDLAANSATAYFIGVEPRHECDLAFEGRGSNGWDQLLTIFRAGRAFPVKAGTRIRVRWTGPRKPVAVFTQENVIEGSFAITRAPSRMRYNRAIGEVLDRRDQYQRVPVKRDHPDLESDPGSVPQRVMRAQLTGITRVSHARRELDYILNASKLRTLLWSWRSPVEALGVEAGDVVIVQHPMPEFAFGGLITGSGATESSFPIDQEIVLASGETYVAIVKDAAGDRLYKGTVSNAAGTVAAGGTITLTADFAAVDGGDGSHVPQKAEHWVVGRLTYGSREVELTSVAVDLATMESDLQAIDYSEDALAEGEYPEIPEETGSELGANVIPKTASQSPELTDFTIADGTVYNQAAQALRVGLDVAWSFDSNASTKPMFVEVLARSAASLEDSSQGLLRNDPFTTLGLFAADRGQVTIEDPLFEAWAAIEVKVRAVAGDYSRRALSLIQTKRVRLPGLVSQPTAPPDPEVAAQQGSVTYLLNGGKRFAQMEVKRGGPSWITADRIGVVPGDDSQLGPTTNFVALPTNSYGEGNSPLLLRYLFGRGLVSEQRSFTPDFTGVLGTTLVAESLEDSGWATGATLANLEVATIDSRPQLQFLPSASGSVAGTYESKGWDMGAVRTVHISVGYLVKEIYPLVKADVEGLAGTRRESHWDADEGPLDPSDPLFRHITARLQIRVSDSASPSGASWVQYVPGVYRCRSFQVRLALTRPDAIGGVDFDANVSRLAVQASLLPRVDREQAFDFGDAASGSALQLRRGTESALAATTPLAGELVHATDSGRVRVGDGSAAGGIPVGNDQGVSFGHASGMRYGPSNMLLAPTNTANVGNFLTFVPLAVGQRTTFTEIGMEVAVGGAFSARLGIYETGADGRPGSLVLDAGTISGAAVGVKTVAITETLDPGWYWLAMVASATVGQSKGVPNTAFIPQMGFPSSGSITGSVGWLQIHVYGALPASASGLIRSANPLPAVFLGL